MIGSVVAAVRMGDWWEHKLVPILTAFYATALFRGQAISDLWLEGLIFLLSLLPGAAFVSVVNDVTDLRSDRQAGKPNRMAPLSPAVRALAVAATLAAGAPFFWYWSDRPLLIALYGAAWLAFSLYSIPPARLKARGAAGVAADAAGAHLFPTLLGAALVFSAAGTPPSLEWMAVLAVWSFACGCRGILWHQLVDLDGDRRARLATFVARHSDRFVERTAEAVLAVEVAALLALLALLFHLLPVVALAYYLLLVWRRYRLWRLPTVVVRPRAAYRFWFVEFYGALLPLSLLAASGLGHLPDLLIVALHLALFPILFLEMVSESRALVVVPLINRFGARRRKPSGTKRRGTGT